MEASLKFINLLPIRVKIYAYRTDKLDLVGFIEGHGGVLNARATKSGMVLTPDIEIHITYVPGGNQGPEYEILESINLLADARVIRIGDVVYEEKTNTLVQRSHSDISGIRVHNKIGIPVRIYFKGVRLAMVDKSDGTGFQAGSPSTVYLNNDTRGFNIGDKLELRLVFNVADSLKDGITFDPRLEVKTGRSMELPWCTLTVSDNYMSDMYLGVINQHYTIPIQDMYSYRAGSPNYSGLKYLTGNKAYSPVWEPV
jgi:hypothetical protein